MRSDADYHLLRFTLHRTDQLESVATDIQPKGSPTRLASIECYRVIAILLVVFIHTTFIQRLHVMGSAYGYLIDLPLYMVFWISVPFFFLVAGYFYGKRVSAGHDPRALLRDYSRPLLLVFVIWVVVYSVVPRNWVTAIREYGVWHTLAVEAVKTLSLLASEHVKLLLIPRPPIYHLWFLPALLMGLATVTGVIVYRREKVAAGLIIGLYSVTLAIEILQFYVPLSYPPKIFLLAMLFTLLGWWISRQQRVSSSLALWLIVGGYMLAFTEGAVLKLVFHASGRMVAHHAFAGGILMVTGIFLYTLANPTLGQGTILPYLARFTLGVYVCHILIEYTLAPLHAWLPQLPVVWHLAYATAVYGLSVGLTLLLSSVPLVRSSVFRDSRAGRRVDSRISPDASSSITTSALTR